LAAAEGAIRKRPTSTSIRAEHHRGHGDEGNRVAPQRPDED